MSAVKKEKPLEEIYPQYVSIFEDAFAKEPLAATELGNVLEQIKTGAYKAAVNRLREQLEGGDAKGYDAAKRSLTAFTMSAYMLTRDKSVPVEKRITRHSGILQGDFDAKENKAADFAEIRNRLAADKHVAFAFLSPSGRGVKVGISIDPEHHRESFQAAEKYFKKEYALQMDKACKDPTRLCFMSYDPDLRINPEAEPIPVDLARETPQREVYHPPVETTAEDIREMLSYIPPRPDYDDWLRISSAVFSALPFGEAVELLNEWSPEEKEGEYQLKHRNRLAEVTIATLAYYAQQYGFDTREATYRKRWAARIRFSEPAGARREDFTKDPNAGILEGPRQVNHEMTLRCFKRQQRGDAELFAALTNGTTLYDHYACCWRQYRAGAWDKDEVQKTPLNLGEEVCKQYGGLIDLIKQDMKENPPPPPAGKGRPQKDDRLNEIEQVDKRIQKLQSSQYLRGAMDFAKSILGTKATLFDKAPHLLVVENGTIDFSEGVFREHRAADFLSKRLAAHYDPDAECPRWMEFLRFFMDDDDELVSYLARAVGYSLTGYVDKDAMFFCYGKGANGKSTFTGALKMLAGDYMTTVSIEALLAKQSDNNFDYKKAEMEGRRIVVTDEIPEDKVLNEAAVKALVGGDEISARRPYEKPYNFTPTHKLWLIGNHKPDVKGTDHGIWRRIHLIPWTVTMPVEQRRPRHEILAEFQEELPGILNWAIRGYIDMVDNGGLNPPAAVRDATEEYQEQSDHFGTFLAERVEMDAAGEVQAGRLLKAYLAWCEDGGERPRYKRASKVLEYLRNAGFETGRDSGNRAVAFGIKMVGGE